ncbi:MAG: cell surface protein, partial [Alistipes sp.]|nr:cell surface protein [Alistipes sp.]
MMASSCNRDEVITDDDPAGGEATSSYRPKNINSQATCNRVFEYTPAPGQFINEDKSGFKGEQTASEAAAYALQRLNAEKYVSLGGFG